MLTSISRIALPRAIVVGLDIHDTRILAVATMNAYGKSTAVDSLVYPLKEGTIVEGELKEPAEFARVIKALIDAMFKKAAGVGTNEPVFILSIPPRHIYLETVFFPPLHDEDLAQSVHLKMETSLPWPMKNAYVDWMRVDLGDPKTSEAVIVAASKPILDGFFKVFLENQWKVGACESHVFSLLRALGIADSDPFLFMLADEDGVEFAVHISGTVVAHSFTPAVNGVVEKTAVEDRVRQIMSYVESDFGRKIKNMYVSNDLGVGAGKIDMKSFAEIPVQTVTLHGEGCPADPQFAVAYGAARRSYANPSVSGEALTINLTPRTVGGTYRENLFSKTVMFWMKIGVIVAALFIAALAGTYWFLSRTEDALLAYNARFQTLLDAQQAQAAPMFAEVEQFNALVNTVSAAKQVRSGGSVSTKLAAIESQAAKNNVSIVSFRAGSGGHILAILQSPLRSGVINMQSALLAAKSFSAITIPLSDLAPEQNLTVNADFAP